MVVRHLEHHQLARVQGVQSLERHGGDDGAEEGPPHGLGGEVGGDLLEREEHAANGGAEGHAHASSCCPRQELTLLPLICKVFGKETGGDVGDAARDMHKWPFLAERKAAPNGQYQARRLDNKRPSSKEALDDKTTKDHLHFGNTGACGVGCVHPDEPSGVRRHEDGNQNVEDVVNELTLRLRDVKHLTPPAPRVADVDVHTALATHHAVNPKPALAITEFDVRSPISTHIND
mmetsp:Transcript_26788/g.63728  ORF Transcript_26788/g.63728 Transcript_26788/m.63728 type:complete len:233 (+) Transcript_26788:1323-2021(+)